MDRQSRHHDCPAAPPPAGLSLAYESCSRSHIRASLCAGRLDPSLFPAADGRLFNRAIQALLGLPFGDTQCGLRAFAARRPVRCSAGPGWDGFAFDVEVLFPACRLGLRVSEVPVRAEERDGIKVQLGVDALCMLGDVQRVRRWAATGTYDHGAMRHRTLAQCGADMATGRPARPDQAQA